MTVPTPSNFEMTRGEGPSWTLLVAFPPLAPSNDLNNYAIEMVAKLSLADPDSAAVFTLTKAGGQIIVDSVNPAKAHIVLPPASTASLPCSPPSFRSVLTYTLEILGSDNKPWDVARGTITVYADATIDT